MIELSQEQISTIDISFKTDKLKDDIALSKFDDYDFDFDDQVNFLENSDEQ